MAIAKPTKPAGCVLQLVGAAFLVGSLISIIDGENISIGVGSVLSAAIGIFLLLWGRQAVK